VLHALFCPTAVTKYALDPLRCESPLWGNILTAFQSLNAFFGLGGLGLRSTGGSIAVRNGAFGFAHQTLVIRDSALVHLMQGGPKACAFFGVLDF
jgi:hypothetical protein